MGDFLDLLSKKGGDISDREMADIRDEAFRIMSVMACTAGATYHRMT